MKKNKQKSVQVIQNEVVTKTPYNLELFTRDIRYLKLKDVKRAYSELIQDYCKGIIQNDEAKVLVYLFTGYIQIIKDFELEKRIQDLENKVGEE